MAFGIGTNSQAANVQIVRGEQKKLHANVGLQAQFGSKNAVAKFVLCQYNG